MAVPVHKEQGLVVANHLEAGIGQDPGLGICSMAVSASVPGGQQKGQEGVVI